MRVTSEIRNRHRDGLGNLVQAPMSGDFEMYAR
jgi:hypothetical protein